MQQNELYQEMIIYLWLLSPFGVRENQCHLNKRKGFELIKAPKQGILFQPMRIWHIGYQKDIKRLLSIVPTHHKFLYQVYPCPLIPFIAVSPPQIDCSGNHVILGPYLIKIDPS